MRYSIGDIVRVIDYGSRVANQEYAIKVYGKLFSLTSDLPFNLNNEINNTDYDSCNDKYTNVEWKIIDFFVVSQVGIILRLRTRTKDDMLLAYRKWDRSLQLVRKAKKGKIIIT